jgi:hypothetical protein
MTAKAMRAILLARATATSLKGFFSISLLAHRNSKLAMRARRIRPILAILMRANEKRSADRCARVG